MGADGTLDLPDSTWIESRLGPIHYREWPGPTGGPRFVCVHGLGGSNLNWALVAPALAELGPVLAPDLAGFGLTPLARHGTGVAANWQLLGSLLQQLELSPVILVGNSMGGMLSLIQAAHDPRSVEALVLVDAAFPRARSISGQPSPRIAALFALYGAGKFGEGFVRQRVKRLGPERLVRETLRVCTADPSSLDPRLVAAMVDMAARRQELEYSAEAFIGAARSIFRSQAFPGRYRALVERVVVPALVIHGALDRLVPLSSARESAKAHDNWELCVFEDLGHLPQMEAPERWTDVVHSWLVRSHSGGLRRRPFGVSPRNQRIPR